MLDRLLVDMDADGQITVASWPEGELPQTVSRARLDWPLDDGALEDLRWYLEDYLPAPFGVWEDRGPRIQAEIASWGEAVFGSVFSSAPARAAYRKAREQRLELVFRSDSPGLLGLPWELMRDGAGPVAMGLAGVSRALRTAPPPRTAEVPAGRLRVLMVISRPAGAGDVGYRMIARPLMDRLDAVRSEVELVVLRPPTLEALRRTLADAAEAGEPFQVMHFDGHGALHAGYGLLALEGRIGGSHPVSASRMAAVLRGAKVQVVVLNACQSGAVGKDVEAAVATRLLREGCAAVVGMAYSVNTVAAAEFMATFYERLFAGDSVSAAVTAGRKRLFEHAGRPSPKGELPLADWLVPVHYLRHEVSFAQTRARRPTDQPSLDAVLDDLRAPGARRNNEIGNLDPAGAFVGRDDLFFDLEFAVRLQKVVVLHGPGGAGKTELAKAFGRWWRDTGGVERPEWVLWHSFEPGVASFGLDGAIAETGLAVFGPDFARLDEIEQRRVVEGLLAQRRLLLIWDNFETVYTMPDPTGATVPLDDAECAKMRGFLARLADGGRSAVIITSRTAEDWLGLIGRIEVGGLAREEAAQLAGELLAPYPAAVPRRERRAFGELLEWLDGHPLSMRLILPHLDVVDPEALLDGLRGTTPLPGGDEGGDRATSLAASITYSFTHLTAATRRLLPAISLCHGVANTVVLVGLSAAPGVSGRFAGASVRQWQHALDDAARVGLLTPIEGGMYRIHPALPAYLAGRWRAEDPENYDNALAAATLALIASYADLASWLYQEIGSGNAELAYTVIQVERRNLGAMLGCALDHRVWKQAHAIAQLLNAYWDVRGLAEEAAAWTDRVQLATEDPDGSPPRLATAVGDLWLFLTGAQANRQERAMHLDDAERTYSRILAMLQAHPASPQQQFNVAATFHQLGMVAQDRGRPEEAQDCYRKSLAIFEDLDNRSGMASSYHQLGLIAQDQGRPEEAEGWYRKSLTIEEDLGRRPGMAISYHQLGKVAQERGRLEEAEGWYRKSLAIKAGLGNRPGLGVTYHQLGMIAEGRARLEEAEDWYRKSLAIRENIGDRSLVATDYHQLGNVAYLRGRLEDAQDWYRRSMAIFDDLGNRPGMASSYGQLGRVAQDQGRQEEAEDCYRKSLAISEDIGNQRDMARSYWQLGLLAEKRGEPHRALEWMVRCVAPSVEFSDSLIRRRLEHLALLAAQLGADALEASWLEITGNPPPQRVHDYINSSLSETDKQP